MKPLLLLIISIIFFAHSSAQAQWVQKQSTQGATRSGAVAWSINNKLYLVGGAYGQALQEYDPALNSWTPKAPLPWAGNSYRFLAMGFVINGQGYICGGTDGAGTYFQDLWMYDPVTNGWTAMTPFPGNGRVLGFGFSIGSKGYIGAGGDNQIFYNDVYEYDSQTNSWASKNPFSGGYRAHLVGASAGNYGYVGAGVEYYGGFINHSDFFKYDPFGDVWAPLADIPGPARLSGIAFGADSLIYAGLGGNSQDPNQGVNYGDMYVYHPSTNVWDTLPILVPGRSEACGAFVNGQPCIATGRNTGARFGDLWTLAPTGNPTGIQQAQATTSIDVFPTYAADKVTVMIPKGEHYTLQVINMAGQSVLTQPAESSFEVNCATWSQGIYLFCFSGAAGTSSKRVFVSRP